MDQQALIYARELARLHRLRRAYEKLLPDRLDPSAPEAPTAMVRTATALFTDLRAFSALGERFSEEPEALLAIVNAHLSAMVAAIIRCGGVVEKFLGDGVLATFGARSEQEDHRERALAAALAVVGANELVNRRRAAGGGFRMDVGVGAAAGKVVVGLIGPAERAELGVLGDPINIAARLVARAGPGEILVAASLYRGVAANVRAELVGLAAVRGRRGKVEVYRLSLSGRTP